MHVSSNTATYSSSLFLSFYRVEKFGIEQIITAWLVLGLVPLPKLTWNVQYNGALALATFTYLCRPKCLKAGVRQIYTLHLYTYTIYIGMAALSYECEFIS